MIDISKSSPTLIIRPGPNDANVRGDIFGGWLMSHIDVAASITAGIIAKGLTATVAVESLRFIQPIYTYDIVHFFTEVAKIGKTSVTINVEVFAQRTFGMSNPQVAMKKVSDATLVFVAISAPGEKRIIEQ